MFDMVLNSPPSSYQGIIYLIRAQNFPKLTFLTSWHVSGGVSFSGNCAYIPKEWSLMAVDDWYFKYCGHNFKYRDLFFELIIFLWRIQGATVIVFVRIVESIAPNCNQYSIRKVSCLNYWKYSSVPVRKVSFSENCMYILKE